MELDALPAAIQLFILDLPILWYFAVKQVEYHKYSGRHLTRLLIISSNTYGQFWDIGAIAW